jgi:hypothetical protein
MTNPLVPVLDRFRAIRDSIRVTIRVLDAGGNKYLADKSKIDTGIAALQPTDFVPLPTWAVIAKHASLHGVAIEELVKRLNEEVIPGLERLTVVELAAVFERTLRKNLTRAATSHIPAASADQLAFRQTVAVKIEKWEFTVLIDAFPSVDAVNPSLRGWAKQIVKRRDWIAHGKHTDPTTEEPTNVSAEDACQRLTDFLKAAGLVT